MTKHEFFKATWKKLVKKYAAIFSKVNSKKSHGNIRKLAYVKVILLSFGGQIQTKVIFQLYFEENTSKTL